MKKIPTTLLLIIVSVASIICGEPFLHIILRIAYGVYKLHDFE